MKLKLPINELLWEEREKKLIFLLLLIFPKDVLLPLLLDKSLHLLAYVIVTFLFLIHWRKILYVLSKDPSLLLILGLSVASIIWSVSPEASLLSIRALLNTSLLAAYIATYYKPHEQLKLWAGIFFIWGVLSLLIELVYPSYGANLEFWTGLFAFKYGLGLSMALGSAIAISNMLSKGKYALFSAMCLFPALVLLIFSQSTTNLLALVLSLLPLPIYIFSKQSNYKLRIILYVGVVLLGISLTLVTFLNIETIVVDWLGKDFSLTGRLPLWQAIFRQGMERPWFGYGHGAFWSTKESIQAIRENAWPDLPPTGTYLSTFHSHNGFLELFLNLGFLGVLAFAVNFCLVLSRVVFLFLYTKTVESLWMLQTLIFMIVVNISEVGTILVGYQLLWILYITVALSSAVQCEGIKMTNQPRAISF
jgi:exopolysaccharide production protein ExoQ